MKFALMYCAIWVGAMIWFTVFSVLKMRVVRNLAFVMALGAGAAAVGCASDGFANTESGPFLLLALAFGVGGLTLPMLGVNKYFETTRYCKIFPHKRGPECGCTRCGMFLGHVRGEDCKCTVCGQPMNHLWLPA